ncbi:AbrB/MazE/SpoVT family DNA-binding domain-containing protein [Mycobacterium haemophilum]|uniref:AbrB/MazE/SpoVT family DNA-binding domain-containing protein n=1 Tax=Mycobacterium haemophilum TaxID=29311 RepID=UPI0012DFF9BB|nr:AbrB/MazE/SpoVT family DNA-binding domain-containing protein [Mycobacterium haemophilum]
MRATIDKAGRLVIPKPLRDHLGLQPGEVEVTADGAGLRMEPLSRRAGGALCDTGRRGGNHRRGRRDIARCRSALAHPHHSWTPASPSHW